jgi:acetate CoA/acetoacetate CoA-transferase alpha subunit
MINKWIHKETFIDMLEDEMSIMVGGFLTCGTPEKLIDWICESSVKDLTIICNDAGYPNQGVGKLIKHQKVKRLIATHIGTNPDAAKLMYAGLLQIDLIPQGTFVDQIRAKGGGLGGILTPVGVHTIVEKGKQIIKLSDGKPYILAEALGADLAIINAYHADPLGSLVYSGSARNFNPVMATAADKVIALVEEKVDEIDPEVIITPHIFVDYLILGGKINDR